MKNENGTWTGISIELWRQIADKLDLNYQFKELSIAQILEGVVNGSLDAGVAAFTITSEGDKFSDLIFIGRNQSMELIYGIRGQPL